MLNDVKVNVILNQGYDKKIINSVLPSYLFDIIKQGDSVVIKPNWVSESHKTRLEDWDYVITHPVIISAVLDQVCCKLQGIGRISIIDGPITEASFSKILEHYPVEDWYRTAREHGVELEIIDLRDYEWRTQHGITIDRIQLPGDPEGKVIFDLQGESSEFFGHNKSKLGYYGADYCMAETNKAHDGYHNLYSVSKTVIKSDVFINLPKLKTHSKAGITCCLKNLVGINTYKNYLPHHSEGGPDVGGDQFQAKNFNSIVEGPIIRFMKSYVLKNSFLSKMLSPLAYLARIIFGESHSVIRNGSWYGNDTLWRMVLDLNKILLYGNPDGSLRSDYHVNAKSYIGIVDAIFAGEGEGPLSPDCVQAGLLICGSNPVAIDATCASLMGFDPSSIPTIKRATKINNYKLCDFDLVDIDVIIEGEKIKINQLPGKVIPPCVPALGWKNYIEF